jgi:glycerate 2-kinase
LKSARPAKVIKNYKEIIDIDRSGHRSLILKSFNLAINAVQPGNLLKKGIEIDGLKLRINESSKSIDLKQFDKILVVGGGKASGAMAEALETMIPNQIELIGSINVLEGTSRNFRTKKIKLNEASHPIPNKKGVESTEKMLSLLGEASSKSLVICLLSGGGSALMTLPAEDLTLEDKIRTTSLLLKSGASIEEVNCVRKHLSRIKGGQLVRYCNGALLISLILSDIIGNPIESIASGPTAPDPTTFKNAMTILSEYDLNKAVETSVLDHFKKGAAGLIRDTPKPKDQIFRRVTNLLLGDNSIACKAAILRVRREKKFRVFYLGSSWHGEARNLGENFASLCLHIQGSDSGFKKPTALVWGGETTVTLRGSGKGGRNQEEALAALNVIGNKSGITLGFLATDGIDGFTDYAGAIVDSMTYSRAREKDLDPKSYLSNNDSNTFFKLALNSLIKTGATGTNVNDIGIALIE